MAFFTTMGTAIYSDKVGKRGPFLMFWVSLAIIGYILFLTVPISNPVRLLVMSDEFADSRR